jgi:ATP-dependent DNA helicase RecG
MISEQLKSIIRDGEGLTIEFKECTYQGNKDVYETVCAFLNRSGGHIILGVDDNGNVTGIDPGALPNGHGVINPSNFTSYPKNPVIARFFKEIGRADELGSGVRNLYKFTKIYSKGGDPQLLEGDIFRIIVPISADLTAQGTAQVDKQGIIVEFCEEPRTSTEIMEYLKLTHREHFRKHILKPLIENGVLHMTIPDKPRSPNQKYYSKPRDKDHV